MGLINRAIVCCSCGNISNYSQTQFKIKHPDLPIPQAYIGKKAYSLLETLPNSSEVRSFLSTILKKKGRYSYLLEWNEVGTLTHVYNYQKNKEIR